jgi:hypothetical protein
MKRGPDETPDLRLVEQLIFAPPGLELHRFTHAETVARRTPDFRVFCSGNLVAFCEVKSPRDDWLDNQLDAAPEGQIVGGLRDDPTFNRIARHVEKAATQFDAVNKSRQIPNVLIFVNHDPASHFGDLRETVTGMFHAEGGERFVTMANISEGRIAAAKQRIDLYVWIDVRKTRVQGYLFNQTAIPNHVKTLGDLFGLDISKIKY